MSVSAVPIGGSTGFPGTIAYGVSLPAGTWVIVFQVGFGQGGAAGSAFDSAGNQIGSTATVGGHFGGVGNNNQASTYVVWAKLAHAVGPTDFITPNTTIQGDIQAYYLSGYPDFSVSAGTGTNRGTVAAGGGTPVHVADTDLTLPAVSGLATDGTQMVLAGWSVYNTSGGGFPGLDVPFSTILGGAGNYFSNGHSEVLAPSATYSPPCHVTSLAAQVWSGICIVVTGFPPGSHGLLFRGGVSLARSSAGFMFAAWQDLGAVYVARSMDQAFHWPLQTLVATDAAEDAAPWLFIRNDELFLIYHSAANFLVLYRLPGLLDAAPAVILSAQPYRFPCAVLVYSELLIVAAYDLSSHLKVFSSPDFGVTLNLLKDYGVQQPERPALAMDRHLGLHLMYRTTTNVLKWDSCPTPAGNNWLGATTFQALGAFPSMALGPMDGFVTWFGNADFATLFISSLGPDCQSLGPLALPPAVTALNDSPGTWVDEHDEWWFLARRNRMSFPNPPPPGSPPADTGGGGAIIGGGGTGGFGGAIGDIES